MPCVYSAERPRTLPSWLFIQGAIKSTAMDDNASWSDGGRRLAPIAAPSRNLHNRLPPFAHLAQVGLVPNERLPYAEPYSQSIPELRTSASPAVARQTAFSGRPRGRSYALKPRTTHSSPLVNSIDVDEPSTPSYQDATSVTSSIHSFEGPSSNKHRKSGRRSQKVASATHDIPRSAWALKPALLTPPISPPSPPLTSSSSEPNLSTYATSAVETIAQDKSILPSTIDKNIDEYITASMVLDLSRAGLVQEAREEIDNLFGLQGDSIQSSLDALYTRRQELLAEWGQDAKTLLTDKSLERFHMRLMILDIDSRVRLLQVPR